MSAKFQNNWTNDEAIGIYDFPEKFQVDFWVSMLQGLFESY